MGVDALFLCGGHGTCVDFHASPALKRSVEILDATGKAVAAVCHDPVRLPQCAEPDGTLLMQGRTVTRFTNSEEATVREQGGRYESGPKWSSKVCVNGTLVTGQNPQSSEVCAVAAIALLYV